MRGTASSLRRSRRSARLTIHENPRHLPPLLARYHALRADSSHARSSTSPPPAMRPPCSRPSQATTTSANRRSLGEKRWRRRSAARIRCFPSEKRWRLSAPSTRSTSCSAPCCTQSSVAIRSHDRQQAAAGAHGLRAAADPCAPAHALHLPLPGSSSGIGGVWPATCVGLAARTAAVARTRRRCRGAQRVVVLSQDMADRSRARGLSTANVSVINNPPLAIDSAMRPALPPPLDEPTNAVRFLFAGNLGRFQGLERLVAAARLRGRQHAVSS